MSRRLQDRPEWPRLVELLEAGASERTILAELGIARDTTRRIRREMGAAVAQRSNYKPPSFIDRSDWPEIRAMYLRRASNEEIVEKTGAALTTISRWRRQLGFPAIGPDLNLRPDWPEIRAMYLRRASTGAIARKAKVNRHTVSGWRKFYGFPDPIPDVREARVPFRPTGDKLFRRISACVPDGISADLRDDIVSEMYLAHLEGELPADQIAGQAQRYIGRAFNAYANRFGPRSLDERLSDDNEVTGLDRLEDDKAADGMDYALMRGLLARGVNA